MTDAFCEINYKIYRPLRIVCCIGTTVGRLGQIIRKDYAIKGRFVALSPFKMKNGFLPERPN